MLLNWTLSFQVIEVKASVRTGKDDFVLSLRKSLKNFYGDKVVALGGVFLIEKGSAHIHIMVKLLFLFDGMPFPPSIFIMKLKGHIDLGLSVRASVCVSVRHTSWGMPYLMHAIWIPHGKIANTHLFFLPELSPFLELCPFEKIRIKSDACHNLWTVHARVLKFHILVPHVK